MNRMLLSYTLCLFAVIAMPGRAPAVAPPPVSLPALMDDYVADHRDVANAYDLPGSEIRFNHLTTLNTQWLARLKTIPFKDLPQSAKVDYLLLRNELERGLSDMARERKEWTDLDVALAFRHEIYALELARLNNEPLDSQSAALSVSRLTRQVRELRERVSAGLRTNTTAVTSNAVVLALSPTHTPLTLSAPLACRAASDTDKLRATLKKWFTFHDGSQPDFSWWLKKPYDAADKALEEYSKLLREEVAGIKGKDDDPIVGQPLGEAALAESIRHEFIGYGASTLIAIGQRELAWCEREMKAAAREMGFGDDWKSALVKVKADFVPPGEQDALIDTLAREAITFVRSRNLVTIPPLCEETWRLTMMSDETMKTIPYAAYNGQTMMVAYARDTMDHDDKLMTMRGNNRHFTRNVTPHELIPGHHLQRFQGARHNTRRAVFSTPFYVEGWALYWERRLWDLGWAKSPEDRMGMLFWRMTRAARVEVSLKFHLGQMTASDVVDFLVDRVGHERMGATGEARRLMDEGFSPLYQAAYMLGSLQLEALRGEVVGRNLMSEQAFNDAVLAENAIPIELIRADLLNIPLTPDFQSSWRFAGDPLHP